MTDAKMLVSWYVYSKLQEHTMPLVGLQNGYAVEDFKHSYTSANTLHTRLCAFFKQVLVLRSNIYVASTDSEWSADVDRFIELVQKAARTLYHDKKLYKPCHSWMRPCAISAVADLMKQSDPAFATKYYIKGHFKSQHFWPAYEQLKTEQEWAVLELIDLSAFVYFFETVPFFRSTPVSTQHAVQSTKIHVQPRPKQTQSSTKRHALSDDNDEDTDFHFTSSQRRQLDAFNY
jgi:hypothetical protein